MDLQKNADRFTGSDYLELYDKYRPKPPSVIVQQAINYRQKEVIDRVVDMGCGAGLGTYLWKGLANEVVGVDPSEEMLQIARAKKGESSPVRFLKAFSSAIPLEDASVDILTCAQSFHWMEPESTLKEVDRLLTPGGVLLIYDAMWPPAVNIAHEIAYHQLFERVSSLLEGLNEKVAHRWPRSGHLSQLKESGCFSYVRELNFHSLVRFSKDDFIGIALSQGNLEALRKRGYSPIETGEDEFIRNILALELPVNQQLLIPYRAWLGVK